MCQVIVKYVLEVFTSSVGARNFKNGVPGEGEGRGTRDPTLMQLLNIEEITKTIYFPAKIFAYICTIFALTQTLTSLC